MDAHHFSYVTDALTSLAKDAITFHRKTVSADDANENRGQAHITLPVSGRIENNLK
jgi:hypothetical protein